MDEVALRLRVTTAMSASLLAEQLAGFVTLTEAEAGRARLVRAVGTGDPARFDDAEVGRELRALSGSRPGIASTGLLDLDGVLRACPEARSWSAGTSPAATTTGGWSPRTRPATPTSPRRSSRPSRGGP